MRSVRKGFVYLFVFSYSMAADGVSSQHCQSIICHEKRFHIRKKNIYEAGHVRFFSDLWIIVIWFCFCGFCGVFNQFHLLKENA